MNDNLQAFDVFALTMAQPKACAALERKHFLLRRKTSRFSLEKLQACTEEQKRAINDAALEVYRKRAHVSGQIDFDKFKQWCHDHPKILAIGVAMKCLFVFALFFI